MRVWKGGSDMQKKIFLTGLAILTLTGNICLAGFNLSGDDIEFDMESNLGVAKGHVVLMQDGGRATGNYAQFNNKTKSGYLQGNVVADKDGYHITADTLTVHDENHSSASGNAVLMKDGKTLKAPLIDYYKAQKYLQAGNGRATLIDTDGSVVEANEINYNHGEGVAKANGNVNIRSEVRKLVASADSAIYRVDNSNSAANYLELIGNASATQDGNTVRGNRLRLNNAKIAQADGRVIIDYTPKPTEQKAGAAAATENFGENKGQQKTRRVRAYPDASEEA